MITKTQLISSLDTLPDNLTIEQVIDHLVFVDKVQKGIHDSNNNKVNTVNEARQKLKKWLK